MGAAVRADSPLGVENAAGWGRHTAVFLSGRGYDVRDVCANRTARQDRARQRGKSDTLDSERIARETLAHPLLPKAFKRAGQDHGPDELHQLLALWNNRRRSILTSRQHLVNEAEQLLCELPLALRHQLPDSRAVRPRLAALARRNRRRRYDPPTRLRLQMLDGYRMWWSYVPHFINTPGYVYAYAYGQLLALSVYSRYLEQGPSFAPAYLEMLAAGGSRSPEELGRIVGIDLADPGFWDSGLDLIEQQLRDAEELVARRDG